MEPTDNEVNELIERNPGGMTLDQIAEVFGVTRQRAQQLVTKATEKALRAYRRRRITCVRDALPDR